MWNWLFLWQATYRDWLCCERGYGNGWLPRCCAMGSDSGPILRRCWVYPGYPTQKPEALLERLITASSNEGDVVLDPFCGCGTAIAVSERLNRQWIGIDITHLAITLIKTRLLVSPA